MEGGEGAPSSRIEYTSSIQYTISKRDALFCTGTSLAQLEYPFLKKSYFILIFFFHPSSARGEGGGEGRKNKKIQGER